MPDEPTNPGRSMRRAPAHRSAGAFSWRHPATWTMKQRWGAGIGALAVVLAGTLVALLASSGGHTKLPNQPAAPPTTPPTATTPASHKRGHKPGPPVCPLTGTPAPGGKVAKRPALAFKIDNYPTARPWTGIDKADIVFEEPVEGFITRLVAVFQCQEAPLVGPIRSARQADQGIVDLLSHPILIHVGSINQVTDLLDASNVINIDLRYPQYGGITVNPPNRQAPYDTYASTASAWGLEPKDTTAPTPVFQYSVAVPKGTPQNTLAIDFSSTSDETWTYHANTRSYTLSYTDTGPAMIQQLPSGQQAQISTSNIVVQVVRYQLGPWVENSEGGLEVMVQPTGDGPLEVLRNGVVIKGAWERSSLSSPLKLVADNSTPIKLKPGTTWVEVVPSGQTIVPTP